MTDLLENLGLFFEDADRISILYCYNSLAPGLTTRKYLKFQGIPTIKEILELGQRSHKTLIVFDDLTER